MKSRTLLKALAPLALLAMAANAAAATLLETKSITCGCCGEWVEHMKKADRWGLRRFVDHETLRECEELIEHRPPFLVGEHE